MLVNPVVYPVKLCHLRLERSIVEQEKIWYYRFYRNKIFAKFKSR